MTVSNGSYLDEDCADITDWTDSDSGTDAESSQVTFDAKSCFKFDSGVQSGSNFAHRERDIGTYGDRVTVSLSVYHSALGTIGGEDYFTAVVRLDNVMLSLAFASDGLFIHDGTSWNEVGVNLVSTGVWQEWTIDCDFSTPASATCEVYLNDVSQASGVDCSRTGIFTDGRTQLMQYGYTTANRITHVDWIKTGSALDTDSVTVSPGPVPLVSSLTGDTLSEHVTCTPIPLTVSLDGTRLEVTVVCDPILLQISVEGVSLETTAFPDPIEVVIGLTGDYSEFIVATPIEVTLGLTGGYAHEYVVIATPIEIGTTLTADWPNVLVSPGPIPLTTRLLGEGVITDKAEIILYFYSNGQLITTKTISLTPAIAGQEWLRTRFPIELKGRHLSIKVECTGSNRETYLYDYGLDLRVLNER